MEKEGEGGRERLGMEIMGGFTFLFIEVKDFDDARLGPSCNPVLGVVEDHTLNWRRDSRYALHKTHTQEKQRVSSYVFHSWLSGC